MLDSLEHKNNIIVKGPAMKNHLSVRLLKPSPTLEELLLKPSTEQLHPEIHAEKLRSALEQLIKYTVFSVTKNEEEAVKLLVNFTTAAVVANPDYTDKELIFSFKDEAQDLLENAFSKVPNTELDIFMIMPEQSLNAIEDATISYTLLHEELKLVLNLD